MSTLWSVEAPGPATASTMEPWWNRDGAASTRETIIRSEGRRRWCRVISGAIAGDRPQCELTPHSHRTQTGSSIGCESVTQQRIVQRIGSDAVEDRDEGRRGDGDWRCDRKQQWWRRWLVHRPPSLGQRCNHHSALRGLPSLHSIATRPTVARRGTMYVCVHRVALSAAPPPSVFCDSPPSERQFRHVFTLFCDISNV